MAYWWVFQNRTYDDERRGGFLWAPIRDAGGQTPHHWATVSEVRAGDLIFSCVDQQICAMAVAVSDGYPSPRPDFRADVSWDTAGTRADVEYRDLAPLLPVASLVSELRTLLPDRYSPLNRLGSGNQGYLFRLTPRAGRLIVDRAAIDAIGTGDEAAEEAIRRSDTIERTTREALIKSRIGQGAFREALLNLWQRQCAVSGLARVELLRASHIKPWRDSNNSERLDSYNGLLLGPAYDAAFDVGLISFDDDGRQLLSRALSADDAACLGLSVSSRIRTLHSNHLSYLAYHRAEVFKP